MSNYNVNYNDERFTEVENDKEAALSEVEKTYGGMISDSDKYYQAQIDASKQWAETQKNLQNEQTDFAIEQIEQQKDQAKKDYTKEQSGAYTDWQKQSAQHGVNAEKQAANGMQNTGYAESSQVSMYNTYQSRITAAREAYTRAVLNYDNAIKNARLQNNAQLAQIAYEALQQQLELSLQGFQYKNQLILEKANKKTEVDNIYYNRYQDVLKQINQENALAEEVRQYNESMAFQREQFNWQKAQAAAKASASGGSSGSSKISKSSRGSSSSKKQSSSKNKIVAKGVEAGKKLANKSDSGAKVDMKSVLALGYGPISASTLDGYIKRGIVEEYEKDGKLKYRKVISSHAGGR